MNRKSKVLFLLLAGSLVVLAAWLVHVPNSVLKRQTPKDRDSLDDESLDRSGSRCGGGLLALWLGMAGSITGPAKDTHAIDNDLPIGWDANFAAAENCDNFNHDLIPWKVCLGQVDLKAAENGDDISAHEILGSDPPSTAPKHVDVVQPRRRRIVPIRGGLPVRAWWLPLVVDPFANLVHALLKPAPRIFSRPRVWIRTGGPVHLPYARR